MIWNAFGDFQASSQQQVLAGANSVFRHCKPLLNIAFYPGVQLRGSFRKPPSPLPSCLRRRPAPQTTLAVAGFLVLSMLLNVHLFLRKPPIQPPPNPPVAAGPAKSEEEIRKEVEEEIWSKFDSDKKIDLEDLKKMVFYQRLAENVRTKIEYNIEFIQKEKKGIQNNENIF